MTPTPGDPGGRRSHGIPYNPAFGVGDRVSCFTGTLSLILPTASVKLCFTMSSQTPLLLDHIFKQREMGVVSYN